MSNRTSIYQFIKSIATCAIGLLFFLSSLFLLFEAIIPEDAILKSLPKYSEKEYYSSGGFQDTTDYAKYKYQISEDDLQSNAYLQLVGAEQISQIKAYIENFEEWVSASHDFPAESYDFDKDIISEGDYCYIANRYQEPEKAFWNYDVYYFDLETLTLYYFHSNI